MHISLKMNEAFMRKLSWNMINRPNDSLSHKSDCEG